MSAQKAKEKAGAEQDADRPADEEYEFEYDKGGIPFYLVLVYVAFLTLTLFYVLDNLIPSWWSLVWHIDP